MAVSSGLSSPDAMTSDLQGNLYVAEIGIGKVLKETATSNGYQATVVASGLSAPAGVTVDSQGNVFITDSATNQIIKETLSGTTYSQAVLPISGLSTPMGIYVDASGNLYICDVGNARVVKESLAGSNYSQTTVETGTVADHVVVDKFSSVYVATSQESLVIRYDPSGSAYAATFVEGGDLGAPISLAVDSNGVLYIADGAVSQIKKAIRTGTSTYQLSEVVSTGSAIPSGIGIDGNNNLYFDEESAGAVLKLSTSGYNFGPLAVGTSSAPVSLTFSFDSTGSIALPAAVTQGITGLDYNDAGTGSCTTNGSSHMYSPGDSCTVDVVFAPKGPGARYGAVRLSSLTGSVIATGYLQGIGNAPRAGFLPGVQQLFSSSNITRPVAVAADPAGNLYIANSPAALSSANAILKETWTGSGYAESVIAKNLAFPLNLTLDGAGNVYVLDEGEYSIFKFSPNGDGTYTQSTFDIENGNSSALAVDGAGNVYFATGDNAYQGGIQIDSSQEGSYGSRSVALTTTPNHIAVDASGAIYFTGDNGSGYTIYKETPTTQGWSQSTAFDPELYNWLGLDNLGHFYLQNEYGVDKVSSSGAEIEQVLATGSSFNSLTGGADGNVYAVAGYPGNSIPGTITRIDFFQSPVLHYSAVAVGTTNNSVPTSVTLQNSGNAPLQFVAPVSESNPALPEGYNLLDSSSSDCSFIAANGQSSASLASDASCALEVSYSPISTSDTSGWMTVTDNSLNAPAPSYASQQVALAVVGAPQAPTLTWQIPKSISYGTPLGAIQLNAVASVPGSLAYSPAAGTVLTAGQHTLTATFTPTDTDAFQSVSTTVTIAVTQATPVITWAAPSPITYGTALSSTQLNASTPVAGTLQYSPAAGTVLNAGIQTLSVTFTPNDAVDYFSATATVTLTVEQVKPSISWTTPAPIVYGTALSASQLDATANVSGTFSYSPGVGAVLMAGIRQLTVTFTPNDATNYQSVSLSVPLTVNQAKPVISWATPAPITYGTALSATQLNATSNIAGNFTYYPWAAGSILSAGSQGLTTEFIPTDNVDYETVTASVTLVVNQATPKITWTTPASITYGTSLGATQLNATSATPGSFAYAPVAGTILDVGAHTLTATFTPTDHLDYTSATASVTLQVAAAKTTPTITWTQPSAIVYGTALSPAQLNASAPVGGTFSYTPGVGTVLGAGMHVLTVTFTPSDTNSYNTATASTSLTVRQATPTISWTPASPIVFGTVLGAAQLDATASVPGTFAYSAAAGASLPVGDNTLSVVFSPQDAADYTTATASVDVSVVNPVSVISVLSPPFEVAGNVSFGMSLVGSGFSPSSTVYFGNTSVPTQFVDGSHLTTQVPASVIAQAGILSVTVQSPAPGGGVSNAVQFEVDSSGGLESPSFATGTATVTPGSTATYAVTLPSSASSVSATCLNLPAGATCSFSAAKNVVTVATSSTTPAGTFQITVVFTETVPETTAAAMWAPFWLLPLAFFKRKGRTTRIWDMVCLGLVVMIATAGMGCGGASKGVSSPQPQTHQITSSAEVGLTVQ